MPTVHRDGWRKISKSYNKNRREKIFPAVLFMQKNKTTPMEWFKFSLIILLR